MANDALAILLPCLLAAAVCDVASRKIPNVLSLFIGIAALAMRWIAGLGFTTSLWGAGALFLALALLYVCNLIGGGDVKLMGALALGLAPFDCYRLVALTALLGGALAVLYLLLRRVLPASRPARAASRLRRVAAVESWRIRRGGPLPYGVAIAASGAFILLHPTIG